MRTVMCFTLVICVGVLVQANSWSAEGAKTEVLLQSSASWDNNPYARYTDKRPELTVLRITIPANVRLPWHTHPMPNAAYVDQGELTVFNYETGETRTLGRGEVLPEMVGTVHCGEAGNEDVVLIVFYAGTAGMPLSEPFVPSEVRPPLIPETVGSMN